MPCMPGEDFQKRLRKAHGLDSSGPSDVQPADALQAELLRNLRAQHGKKGPDAPEWQRNPLPPGLKDAALRPYSRLIGQWSERVSMLPHQSRANPALAELLAHLSSLKIANHAVALNLLAALSRLRRNEFMDVANLAVPHARDAAAVASIAEHVAAWPDFRQRADKQELDARIKGFRTFLGRLGGNRERP